jgi:hypothetical protein
MKNADIPAMPCEIEARVAQDNLGVDLNSAYEWHKSQSGLTKREMFAMAAMQGLLADSNVQTISAVNMAVECADLLLRKLDGEDINPPIMPNPDWPEEDE